MCHWLYYLSRQRLYSLYIYLEQCFHHELGFAQARQVAVTCHSDATHTGSVGRFDAGNRVFNDERA